jgi:hypothetical protein
MVWTDAIRDVDSCRQATGFLIQTLGLRRVFFEYITRKATGKDSEQ